MTIFKAFAASASFTAILFIAVVESSSALEASTKAEFWEPASSRSRAAYETMLAKHILENTRSEFGDYVFNTRVLDVNFDRGRRIVADGKLVNFYTNPLPVNLLEEDGELKVISIPVMQGLLGYRFLIVRKTDLEKFKKIQSFSDLQQFRAGQVNYWADVEIYEENNLPVVLSTSFESLFYMLSRGRFDYIPLSVGEATQTLSDIKSEYGELAIVPSVIIYYPFPVFFQVSKEHPTLVNRLTKGLIQAQKDGSLTKLFNEYFADEIKELAEKEYLLFQLGNSNLPKEFLLGSPMLTKKARVFPAPGVARQ